MTAYRFRLFTSRCLLAILAFSVLAFGTVETWSLAAVEISIFLLAAVWAVRRIVAPYRFVWTWFYLPLAAIPAWAALQVQAGWTASNFLTAGEMWKWLAYLAFFALCVNVSDDGWIRRQFTHVLVWFGFAVAVYSLLQHYHSPEAIYWLFPAPGAEIFGPFADRNHFAVLMELLFPPAMVLAMRAQEKKLVYYVACGLMLASVIVCASRAGAAVIVAELLILVTAAVFWRSRGSRQSWRRRAAQGLALAAVAVLLIVAAGTERVIERFQDERFERGLSRFAVAAATWEKAMEQPFTGHGLGSFQGVFRSFAPFDDGYDWPHAHNDPIQFVFELGALGLIVPLALAALVVFRRRPREVWLGNVLPLAGAWGHSLTEFPFQMPSLMLVTLALLAQIPAREGGIVGFRDIRSGRKAAGKQAEPVAAAA